MKPVYSLRNSLIVLSILAAIFIPQTLLHAQITWSGNGADDNWSTSENWSGVLPADGDALVFAGSNRLVNTNNLLLASNAWVRFDSDGFFLNGNSLTLTGGITNSVGTNKIGMNVNWAGASPIFVAPGSELIIAGTLTNTIGNTTNLGGGRIRLTGSYVQTNNPPATILNNIEYVIDGGTFINGGGVRISSGPVPAPSPSKLILTNGAVMNQIIQAGAIRVGDSNGISGQLNMYNSTLTLVSNIIHIPFVASGIGSVTQVGGTNSGAVINFNQGTGGTGSYDMTGGVLETYVIKKSNSGTGTASMSFDGSTVRALAGEPTAFFTGLNTALIKVGGLTIDGNGETFTVSQVFTGPGRLTKIGGGTVTLNGASTHTGGVTESGGTLLLSTANTFTGGVILGGGTLQIGNDAALGTGTLALNGGTFRSQNATAHTVTNSVTLGGSVTFSSTADLTFNGPATLTGSRTLTVNNTNTINGAITESGGARSLTKAGTGILQLSNSANNYSGGTIVSVGTLKVVNTSGSATGSGTTTVTNLGILTGTGSVAAISVLQGGKVAPGSGVGSLVASNATFDIAGSYQVEMSDANTNLSVGVGVDFLNIPGALTITSSSASPFVIELSSLGGLAANFDNTKTYSWIIATASGGITGFSADKFSISTNNFQNSLGANAFSVSVSGNNLLLNFGAAVVPQPTINRTIQGAGTTNAQVSWSSVSGASYTVQYKTNLNQPDWLTLTNLTATSSSTSATDSTSPVPSERYYRVTSP